MNRKNSSNDHGGNPPSYGTQLPGSFENVSDRLAEEEKADRPGDSTPVSSPAHGTQAAPPASASSSTAPQSGKTQSGKTQSGTTQSGTTQSAAPTACDAVTRTYAPGDHEINGVLQCARTLQPMAEAPQFEGNATGTRRSTEPPKMPTAGKSTWNLRIREHRVAGHISGITNTIPADPDQATGLLSALAGNEALPEYEILGELGAGSMGVVYRARQTSLNRDLAIKTLKPGLSNPDYDQAMFVTEAVVTAHLVHPNIVPIHDLGRTADGKLFYSMKQVSGTPWDHNIREMSLEQNLEILLKVCDGVAFAHSRGVINRDLKPENVIVGDYGEVVVLDWGLALTIDGFARRDSVMLDSRGGGGTPVYMAPELADSDVNKVGIHTDVYLLGAMLFEILEGRGPHWLRQIEQMANPEEQLNAVIWAVLQNDIETQVDNEGELMQIARKAMSTHPMDRYETVVELQETIREYRITGRAEELMQKVESKKTTSYSEYQSAVALYEEALRKWPSNRRALDGDRKARKAYAELALKKGDVDLGLQILPERTDRDFEPVRKKLKSTRRNRAIMRGTWLLATVGAAVAAFFAISYSLEAEGQRQEAVVAKEEAVTAKEVAVAAKEVAVAAKKEVETKSGTILQLVKQEKELTDKSNQAQVDLDAAKLAEGFAKKAASDAKMTLKTTEQQLATVQMDAKKAVADKRAAEAAQKVAEWNAAEATAKIDSAKAQVEDAQKAAFKAFLDQVVAKTEIRKFDEAVSLIETELAKEDVNPSIKRKEDDFRKQIKFLKGKAENEALDVTQQISSGKLSGDGSALVIESSAALTVFRNVQSTPPGEGQGHELELVESPKEGGLTVSKNGDVICSIGRKKVQVWAWNGITYLSVALPETAGSITAIKKGLISKDGNHLYLISSRTNKYTLVDVYSVTSKIATVAAQVDLCKFMPNTIGVTDAVLLPDESGLVLLTPQENLRLVRMNWQDDAVRFTLPSKGDRRPDDAYPLLKVKTADPVALQISEDGAHIAVLLKNTGVMVLKQRVPDGPNPFPYEAPAKLVTCNYAEPIRAVRFSADNSRLMVAQLRYLQIWDKADGAWKLSKIEGLYAGHSLAAHTDEISVAGFLKGSNNRLISCSKDDMIRLWNTDTYGDYVAAVSRQNLAAKSDPIIDTSLVSRCQHDEMDPATGPQRTANTKSKYIFTGAQLTSASQIARPARRFQQGRKVYSAEFSAKSERIIIGSNDLAAHAFNTGTGQRTLKWSMLSPRDPFFAPEKNNFVEGHIPEIVSLMFLPPNGDLLLTFDYFGSLSVWDAKDDEDGIGFEKSRLLPENPVDESSAGQPYEVIDPSCEVAVSKDGKWLIAGIVRNDGAESIEDSNDEYFAAIWNTKDILETGQALPAKELKGVYKDQITAAAISLDSKTAITATRRGSFVLWDIETKTVLAQSEGAHNSDSVSGIFFVSDTEFVSAGFDGGVLRWEIKNGELTPTRIERPEIERSENEELDDGKQQRQANPDFIIRLRPSPDGKRFVTSDLNRERKSKDYRLTLSHWSVEKGWQTLPVSVSAPQSDLGKPYRHEISWSADGQEILFVHDGRLDVLDATTLQRIEAFQLPAGNDAVRGAIAPKGPGGMCVATFDGRLAQLWNLSDGKKVAEFRSHGPVVRAGFSADGKYVITSSDSIRVFHADENSPDHGLPVFRLPRNVAGPRLIEQAKFSTAENDDRFASIDTAGTVRLWNWNTDDSPPSAPSFDSGPAQKIPEWMEDEEIAAANRLAWSPDGSMLGTIQQGRLRLWQVSDDGLNEINVTLPADISAESLALNAIDFSPDGTRVVAGGVRWTEDEDLESWGVAFKLRNGDYVPIAILEAEGGQRHSASKQGPATAAEPELRGITAVAFNDMSDEINDGSDEIITAGADSNILTWFAPDENADEPEMIRPLGYREGRQRQDGFLDPHAAPITALDVAADGSLVSADESGWIVIWPPGR